MTAAPTTVIDPIEPTAAARAELPRALAFDDRDSAHDVIDSLIIEPFVTGELPWSRMAYLPQVREDASLLPGDGVVVRTAVDGQRTTQLVRGGGWLARIGRWQRGAASVTVVAIDDVVGQAAFDQAVTGAAPEPEPEEVAAPIGFWHQSGTGPVRHERTISATPWTELRVNYTRSAAEQLDQLMALDRGAISGRILLLHGPPGTGKTTALRTLAYVWRDWCQFDVVLDPERLFGNPGYLMHVAVGDEDDPGRWRLLLLEDCDELIRAEAKSGAGQALARLLNITDGLLGQGLELIVALTTNEPLGRLHPAVTRPGRCLAEIEVGALTPAEAAAWLGRPTGTRSHLTLAELYARRRGARTEPPVAVGQYL